MIELQTGRLRLREFSEGDLESLVRLDAGETTRGFAWEGGRNRRSVERSLRRWLAEYPRGFGQLAMIHREDDALIGHCGLEPSRDDGALLSYALSKDYWCKGLVPEACRAVLRYGFGELGLEEIWTATSPDNRAWRSMMERLGMELREEETRGEEAVVRYALAREKFLALRT